VGEVEQDFGAGSSDSNATGTLLVEILNSTFTFTASGKLTPLFSTPPRAVVAELIEKPDRCPDNLRVGAGTGTVYDFSVHLKSLDYGVPLPPGNYRFRYTAK
jgi:hypothetical protein